MVALSLLRKFDLDVLAVPVACETQTSLTEKACFIDALRQLSATKTITIDLACKAITPGFSIASLLILLSATKILVVRTIASKSFNLDHRTFSLIRNLDWKSASYSEIGILKTFLCDVALELINLFQSIATKPTLKSISGTTTQTVVSSFLAPLVRDLVLTPINLQDLE